MKEKVPKMCITCKHYELYQCNIDNTYIGYLYCQELTKCKNYHLRDEYKRGGKWYNTRKEAGKTK